MLVVLHRRRRLVSTLRQMLLALDQDQLPDHQHLQKLLEIRQSQLEVEHHLHHWLRLV